MRHRSHHQHRPAGTSTSHCREGKDFDGGNGSVHRSCSRTNSHLPLGCYEAMKQADLPDPTRWSSRGLDLGSACGSPHRTGICRPLHSKRGDVPADHVRRLVHCRAHVIKHMASGAVLRHRRLFDARTPAPELSMIRHGMIDLGHEPRKPA